MQHSSIRTMVLEFVDANGGSGAAADYERLGDAPEATVTADAQGPTAVMGLTVVGAGHADSDW